MVKRLFDFVFAFIGILILLVPLIVLYILATLDARSNGIFVQKRVGQFGKGFKILKFKTINTTTREVSFFGAFLRKSKLDELPQLFNVLSGDMSFVGPRPDITGYYDNLQGEERNILMLKPGITSPASIKYRNEEQLLAQKESPLEHNDNIIFPDKVKMNLEYYYNRSFFGDLKIIIKTFI
ncbi:MAG: sugar transferase [Pedobacter sp.]|nr:MAG: sugar transferase [Pedobacter sp.]